MKRRFVGSLIVLLLLTALAAPAAHAQGFARVGPVGFGGYPAWYQDKTGLGMEFCSPTNQSELDGGWCLLLPGDTIAPETFPSPFFDEHFYWAASADANLPGGRALLVLALEGAFAVGPVVPGDQIVFGRLRIVVNPLPASGTYTVYTPFGKYVFPDQVAGDKLFFTEDIGIQCTPGDFTCVLDAKVGPFLLPSPVPGGSEVPPVPNLVAGQDPYFDALVTAGTTTVYPGTGKRYIADPARIGPVTGSALPNYDTTSGLRNPNIFRIEAPNGVVLETFDFSLMGRVFEGATAGHVTVGRASYARSAAAVKVDVFATGLPATQARVPAGPQPAEVTPQLVYYPAPCVPTVGANGIPGPPYSAPAGPSIQMLAAGTNYWGQTQTDTVPLGVCVVQANAVDGAGNAFSAFFPTLLKDEITITQALYDPQNQSLSVQAASSDQVIPPTLTATGFGELTNGALVVTGLIAPPANLNVTSSAFGAQALQVTTGVGGTGPGATVPVAANDVLTVAEDSAATTIPVLANDTVAGSAIPAASIVTLTALPLLGSAVVLPDGTIAYTPKTNANGLDAFTYTVAVSGVVSNQANVTVTITPANDPPVAVNDTFNAVANTQVALPVMANDIDVDGAADLVAVASLSASSPAGATLTAVGKQVTFSATAAGTYSFTYKPQDAAAATSTNTATVTVVVSAAETINVTLAEFRTGGGGRLRFAGTVRPVSNPPQRLTIRWFNGTNTVSVVATPVADALGNWAIDIRPASGIQDPRNSGATQFIVTGPGGGSRTGTISVR